MFMFSTIMLAYKPLTNYLNYNCPFQQIFEPTIATTTFKPVRPGPPHLIQSDPNKSPY